MRSSVVVADLAHSASEPNVHSSPGYFSQGYTVFPKTAEESSVGFNMRNIRFFPLLSLCLGVFFFHFKRAERHKAVMSPVAERFHPPAERPVPFPVGTGSRSSCHGPARHRIASHVLQRTCQCL